MCREFAEIFPSVIYLPVQMAAASQAYGNNDSCSRIHERTISLRFLGIILRVLRLEVSVYNFLLHTSFKPLFGGGGAGVKSAVAEVTVNSKEETLKIFSQLRLDSPVSTDH